MIPIGRPCRGISLTECLVSLVLIALLFGGVVKLFTTNRKGLQQSANQANAAFIGRSLLDQEKSLAFANVVSIPSTPQTISGTDNGAPFSQTINSAVNVTSLDTDKKLVTVTLTWHEATGDKKIVLETLLTSLP